MNNKNMDAERAAFETWARETDQGYASLKGTDAIGGWYYFEDDAHAAWAAWQAARRTAPASAPIGENIEGIPLPALTDEQIVEVVRATFVDDTMTSDDFAFARAIETEAITPYAERIRQLERELAERKTASIGADEAFAWAAFGENGNVIIWSRRRDEVEPVAAKYGRPVVPVIAYIDGRTAGAAPKSVKEKK